MKKLIEKIIHPLASARKELSEAHKKIENLQAAISSDIRYQMFRPIFGGVHLSLSLAPEKYDDEHIIRKLIEGYNKLSFNAPDSMWAYLCDQLKADIHEALVTRNLSAVCHIFHNPSSNNLFMALKLLP